MARRIFISFRYKDGINYKQKLERLFYNDDYIINCSESVDRSNMSEETIKRYLYNKLQNTSLTIVILTLDSLNHKKIFNGYISKYDDWIYDEIRYSLEDRNNNRCNGIIAVYTPDVEKYIIKKDGNYKTVKEFDNLVRKNMFNIKEKYKHNKEEKVFDSNYDHYCSLISWNSFINNYKYYIEIAEKKRDKKEQYDICKR